MLREKKFAAGLMCALHGNIFYFERPMLAPLRPVQSPGPYAKAAMADIDFDCPECLQPIVIDASAAGANVQCPMCSRMLMVPENPSGAVSAEDLGNSQEAGLELNGWRGIDDESETVRTRAELVNAIRDRDALTEEVARSREKATAVIAEFEKLRADLAQARADLVAVAEQSVRARADSARNESELKALIFSSRVELQEQKEAALTGEYERSAGLRRELEELQTAMASSSAEQEKLRSAVTRAIEDKMALQQRIDTLLAEAESSQMNLEAARAERDDMTQKAVVRDAEMREISAQLERQGTGEHTLRLHLEAAEKNSAAALEKVRVFEAEREPINAELAGGRAALYEISAHLERTTSERHAAHERVAELERELARTVDQLQAIENERDMVRCDLEATRAGLERAKQHITVLQSRRDHMRDGVARLKA